MSQQNINSGNTTNNTGNINLTLGELLSKKSARNSSLDDNSNVNNFSINDQLATKIAVTNDDNAQHLTMLNLLK